MINNELLKRRSKQGAFISLLGLLLVILGFAFTSKKLVTLNEQIDLKTNELTLVLDSVADKRGELDTLRATNASLQTTNGEIEKELRVRNARIEDLTVQTCRLKKTAQALGKELMVKREVVKTLTDTIVMKSDSLIYYRQQVILAEDELGVKRDSVSKLESRIQQLNLELKKVTSEKVALNSFLDQYESPGDNTKITPKASVEGVENNYHFTIWLDMTDKQLKKIKSVEYFFNHSSFKNPRVLVDNPAGGFKTTYTGWGCLDNMPITITFSGGRQETIVFKMCDAVNSAMPNGPGIPVKTPKPLRSPGN